MSCIRADDLTSAWIPEKTHSLCLSQDAPTSHSARSGRPEARHQAVRIDEDPPPILLDVRHIGPRRARRLIGALGADWRAVVALRPARVFGTLRGVVPRQAQEAAASWRELDSIDRDHFEDEDADAHCAGNP